MKSPAEKGGVDFAITLLTFTGAILVLLLITSCAPCRPMSLTCMDFSIPCDKQA